jgi:DNA-binding FrmR family transcriptional regulator
MINRIIKAVINRILKVEGVVPSIERHINNYQKTQNLCMMRL